MGNITRRVDSAFEILYCTTKPCLVVEFGTSGTTCASAGVRRFVQVQVQVQMHYGGKLSAANLGSPLGAGTPVILDVAMGLVYGRKSEKNGLFFPRTRPLFLGMERGSISGVMLGVGGKP